MNARARMSNLYIGLYIALVVLTFIGAVVVIADAGNVLGKREKIE